MHKSFAIFLILLSLKVCAQTGTDTNVGSESKARNWDTLKYQKFDYVLIVGIYQQNRSFNNKFRQIQNTDSNNLSSQVYSAESQLMSGIALNYDKFSVSFGTRTSPKPESAGKGYTKTFNLGINIGDNRYVFENYYRRFVGFYNQNTPNFDTSYNRTKQYYLQPNLTSALLMSRFMYFTNYKKYSFKSGFGCNFRQLKSAATWILGGSFNVYNFNNDSAIFPKKVRPLYGDYGGLNGFQSVNFGVTAGAAFTLVLFKAWFAGAYFTLGPEQQWRSYRINEAQQNASYVSWSGTGRASIGLNLKRFYILGSYSNDYNLFNNKALDFSSASISGNFTFGWRFYTNTPKFYKKFQQTKIYKLF